MYCALLERQTCDPHRLWRESLPKPCGKAAAILLLAEPLGPLCPSPPGDAALVSARRLPKTPTGETERSCSASRLASRGWASSQAPPSIPVFPSPPQATFLPWRFPFRHGRGRRFRKQTARRLLPGKPHPKGATRRSVLNVSGSFPRRAGSVPGPWCLRALPVPHREGAAPARGWRKLFLVF